MCDWDWYVFLCSRHYHGRLLRQNWWKIFDWQWTCSCYTDVGAKCEASLKQSSLQVSVYRGSLNFEEVVLSSRDGNYVQGEEDLCCE